MALNSKSTSWNLAERVIFPAPTPTYTKESFPNELILIPRSDGEKVPCLLLPFKHARFILVYFHANAEDLGSSHHFCSALREVFQVHVLAVEYPGYGICRGKATEAGIMKNAIAAMEFVTEILRWPYDGIKLFGRSLGTGPSMALAAKYEVAGLILVSPFTSIRELFRTQVGVLAEMVEDRFRNLEVASSILSPTLIIHGQQDALIPPEHSRKIYASVPTRKMMVSPLEMSHNTPLLQNVGMFVLPMTHFFSLPDYTFEDIEVPSWVFPASMGPEAEAGMLEEEGKSPKQKEETDDSTLVTWFAACDGSHCVRVGSRTYSRTCTRYDKDHMEPYEGSDVGSDDNGAGGGKGLGPRMAGPDGLSGRRTPREPCADKQPVQMRASSPRTNASPRNPASRGASTPRQPGPQSAEDCVAADGVAWVAEIQMPYAVDMEADEPEPKPRWSPLQACSTCQ